MNKKLLFICTIILISICIIGGIIFYILQKNDYSNYMLIKTEESCYKVNKYGKSKKIDSNEFAQVNNKIYSITNCFESYIDRDKNEVLNIINQENCNIFLEDNKDSELLNIINEIANLKHDLFDVKIIHTEKDNYYVSVYLNTNWICPSDLYIYDKNEKKLKLIFETCNETILDVNENNFIY
ncbi:MAG: hypothetical protein IKF38_05550 [Clostridia bacterium]|nr:hypothetical protein [Clostridia bacterium]